MSSINFLIFILINIYQISSQPSPNHKNVQFIGHTRYVSLREEAQRNFCGNFWCTNDAFYLFTKSSQYVGVDPCDDFKNFTVNHVEEVDHPDDRKLYRGFQSIIYSKYRERLRKVVAAKIDLIRDNRVVKVMKNTFQKCLKSPHLTRHLQAHKDIIKHLKKLGGSPYLSKHINFNLNLFNDNAVDYFYSVYNHHYTLNLNFNVSDALWNENKFDLKKIFEIEPNYALSLFLDLKIKRCDEILCLAKPNDRAQFIEDKKYNFEVYKELFNELEDSYRHPPINKRFIIEELLKPTVRRQREFLKIRDEIVNKFKNFKATRISIKNLREKLKQDFDIDWLEIINSQLFRHSKVDENEEILIENGGIEMLQELVRNLINTNKKILADTFVSTFLYYYRNAFILRFHNQQDLSFGTKKGDQRWSRCIVHYLSRIMYPAHIFMYEQFRPIWDRTTGDFDRNLIDERTNIVDSAEKFVHEAVDVFKLRFKKETTLKPSIAIDVLNKLKTKKIVVSLNSKIFTTENLEEFYNELQLNGDEEFLESIWQMERNHRKILNEPFGNWRRQINQMVHAQGHNWITYNIEDGNILYIPPMQIIYPNYHPLRPRFFNMAIFFKEIIGRMQIAFESYLEKKFKLHRNKELKTIPETNVEIAYEHYSDWLKNHTELILGANLLTNRQLYWVALAVFGYRRYQKGLRKNYEQKNQLHQEYMHVVYKNYKGFQDAFKCNMTADELAKYEESSVRFYQMIANKFN